MSLKASNDMKLHEIPQGRHGRRARKRVGRGTGSGKGKTCGRGTKGYNARSGGGVHPTFEGGQLPLIKRLPKLRGFKRRQKIHYTAVSLAALQARFEDGATASLEALVECGLVRNRREPIVILGPGTLTKKLTVHTHRISRPAQRAVEECGGTVEIEALPVA